MTIQPLNFEIHPSSGVPIYRQLMDQVQTMIAGGQLRAGDLLPSVRAMAGELDINMMTVSKAYAKLEADNIVERVRGTGMRVKDIAPQSSLAVRKREFEEHVAATLARGKQLGLTDEQIMQVVKSVLKGWS